MIVRYARQDDFEQLQREHKETRQQLDALQRFIHMPERTPRPPHVWLTEDFEEED